MSWRWVNHGPGAWLTKLGWRHETRHSSASAPGMLLAHASAIAVRCSTHLSMCHCTRLCCFFGNHACFASPLGSQTALSEAAAAKARADEAYSGSQVCNASGHPAEGAMPAEVVDQSGGAVIQTAPCCTRLDATCTI